MNRAMIIRIFRAESLKEIDQRLLLNQPRLWTVKIHFVLYYAGLASVPLGLMWIISAVWIALGGQNIVASFQSFQNYFWPIIAACIFGEIVLLVVWYEATRSYSLERERGTVELREEIVELLAYVGCLLLIMAPAFLSTLVFRAQLADQVAKAVVVSDIDVLTKQSVGTPMFAVGPEFQTGLDQNILSSELRNEFDKQYLPLASSNVAVNIVQPAQWNIIEPGSNRIYLIAKEGEQLSVYDVTAVKRFAGASAIITNTLGGLQNTALTNAKSYYTFTYTENGPLSFVHLLMLITGLIAFHFPFAFNRTTLTYSALFMGGYVAVVLFILLGFLSSQSLILTILLTIITGGLAIANFYMMVTNKTLPWSDVASEIAYTGLRILVSPALTIGSIALVLKFIFGNGQSASSYILIATLLSLPQLLYLRRQAMKAFFSVGFLQSLLGVL